LIQKEKIQSNQLYIFNFKVLKPYFLQQMALDRLQAIHQPARICGNPSACLFTTRNGVISENVSFRQFAAGDGVIWPVHVWAKLPIGVELILPANFQMNLYYTLKWVNLYAICMQVNWYDTHV
jgi:hypothetical protein